MLKSDKELYSGKEEVLAFYSMKMALTNKPILRIFYSSAIIELHTDASKEGFGAILLQKLSDEKQSNPVLYPRS